MTLRERRYSGLLNRALRRLAVRGKYPKFSSVFSLLAKLVGKSQDGTILEPAKFYNGQNFPLKDFNTNLDDVKHEFVTLYDENIYRANYLIQNQVVLEEDAAEIRSQLKKLRAITQRELIISGSNFLDAVVMDFTDLDIIDALETTANVDLMSGVVTLGTKSDNRRVPLKPIPRFPTFVETHEQDFEILAGSDFRALFTNTNTVWQVKTKSG